MNIEPIKIVDTIDYGTQPIYYNVKYQFATPDQYRLDTLKTAEEGVFITFLYQACSNVKTQCCTPPTNVLLDLPRLYMHTTTASSPVCMAFRGSPINLPFLKESLGKARIMQYDVVNEIYYVDNGYTEER